jgi:hypothetical protein
VTARQVPTRERDHPLVNTGKPATLPTRHIRQPGESVDPAEKNPT